MRDEDSRVFQVAEEISAYLSAYSEAADTLEGIATWWLAWPRYGNARETAQRALLVLVAQGLVEAVALPDGGTLYRRARSRTGLPM
jgi:hypothetical protein